MGKKHTGKRREIELEQMNVILKIPTDAVSLTITAKMLDEDGKLMSVSRTLAVSDIQEARKDFLDNVEDGDEYDAHYVLTDEGRAYLDALRKQEEAEQ